MDNKPVPNKNVRNIIIAVACIIAVIVGVVLFRSFQEKKAEEERHAALEETKKNFTAANMAGLWVTTAEDGSTRRFLIYYSNTYEQWFLRTDYFWDSSTDKDGIIDAECFDGGSSGYICARSTYDTAGAAPSATDGYVFIYVRQIIESYDDPIEVEITMLGSPSRMITIQRDKNWNLVGNFDRDLYVDTVAHDYSLMFSNYIRNRITNLVTDYYGMKMSPSIVEYDESNFSNKFNIGITQTDFVNDQGYVSGSISYIPATNAFTSYKITFEYDPVRDDFYSLSNFSRLAESIVFKSLSVNSQR